MSDPLRFVVTKNSAGAVLAALRKHAVPMTWSEARKLLSGRRVFVNGILCIDEGRRVTPGDVLEVRTHSASPPPGDQDVKILFLDPHVVVVNKPAGMLALRNPGDVSWRQVRKDKQPSLEESLQRLIRQQQRSQAPRLEIRLLAVHRIDRETSGILVFARSEHAQTMLIRQFADHSAERTYLCVIPGSLDAQTFVSRQIRDRGDGLRGSCPDGSRGRRMVTHVRPLRRLGQYSELECRLETGRTNQIRIHLAEAGHPICGDVKYRGPFGQDSVPDLSRAPRLALHATSLGFLHPVTQELQRFHQPWPRDMQTFLSRIAQRV
jgi:23S rRNA pseudouridine1911/1915/1917 synthase